MLAIGYIVLFCGDLEASKRFYGVLGVELREERHGNGPGHFSFEISGIVIELYPLKPGDAPGRERLGFKEVEGMEELIAKFEGLGAKRLYKAVSIPGNACFVDPDGRTIEFTPKQ